MSVPVKKILSAEEIQEYIARCSRMREQAAPFLQEPDHENQLRPIPMISIRLAALSGACPSWFPLVPNSVSRNLTVDKIWVATMADGDCLSGFTDASTLEELSVEAPEQVSQAKFVAILQVVDSTFHYLK